MNDSAQNSCHSCSMTIESGSLCRHCSDAEGALIPFDECFERFVQWSLREQGGGDREAAERSSLAFMATMPAWRDHPRVRAAREGG